MSRAPWIPSGTPDRTLHDAPPSSSPFRPTGPVLRSSLAGMGGPIHSIANASSVVLSETKQYSIRQLSHLPDGLKEPGSEPVRCLAESYSASIEPRSGLAVATTKKSAIVWSYATPGGDAAAKTLALPAHVGQFPLAIVVSAQGQGTNSDFGLLLVSRQGGRVVFWDSIDVIHAYALRKDRHTLEETLPSIYESDKAVDIQEVGTSGVFVLRYDSGKTVLLSLRDGRGRVAIKASHLNYDLTSRTQNLQSSLSSSFFAGLKNALFSGPPKNITSITTAMGSAKGTGMIAVSTTTSIFLWETDFMGQHQLRGMVSPLDLIETAIGASYEELQIADIVLQNSVTSDGLSVLVLTERRTSQFQMFHLAEIMVTQPHPESDLVASVNRVIALAPVDSIEVSPRMTVIEGPTKAVLIAHSRAIHLVCFGKEAFQDVVIFRNQSQGVVAAVGERNTALRVGRGSVQGQPANQAAILLSDSGMLRLSLEPAAFGGPSFKKELTALNRIELAAFYGGVDSNPIDFLECEHIAFPLETVEAAAIAVSGQIVKHGTRAIFFGPSQSLSKGPTSSAMLQRCVVGAENVQRMAAGLSTNLSMDTRWHLLADLEKIRVAQRIVEDGLDGIPLKVKDEAEIQTYSDALEAILPKMKGILETAVNNYRSQNQSSLAHLTDAALVSNRVFLALEVAFSERQRLASSYGLDENWFREGMLEDGYETAPEFWTSTPNMVALYRNHTNASQHALRLLGEALTSNSSAEEKSKVARLGDQHCRLVDISCRTFVERVQWCECSSNEVSRETGAILRSAFENNIRSELISPLADLGLQLKGLEIAERFREMHALSLFLLDQLVHAENELKSLKADLSRQQERNIDAALNNTKNEEIEIVPAEERLDGLRTAVHRYFSTFETAFSDAFFSAHVNKKMFYSLVTARYWDFSGSKEVLTDYLHSHNHDRVLPSWLFDANSGNYEQAKEQLYNSSEGRISVTSKLADLMFAKLLSTDYTADGSTPAPPLKPIDYQISAQAKVAEIQRILFLDTKPAFELRKPNVRFPENRSSGVNNLLTVYSPNLSDSMPVHSSFLSSIIGDFLLSKALSIEEVVDILTLLRDDQNDASVKDLLDSTDSFTDASRFAAALSIFAAPVLSGSSGYLPPLTLRRLLLRDDWAGIQLDLEERKKAGLMDPTEMSDIGSPTPGAAAAAGADEPDSSRTVTAAALKLDFSHTILFRTLIHDDVAETPRRVDLVRTIIALAKTENDARAAQAQARSAGRRRSRSRARGGNADQGTADANDSEWPETPSGLAALLPAGSTDDFAVRFGGEKGEMAAREEDESRAQLQALIDAGAEEAVAACLKAAELFSASESY